MREELHQHVELEADYRVRSGMAVTEARRTALRDVGAEGRWLEEASAARGWRPLDEVAQDGRYAWRALRRTPSFALRVGRVIVSAPQHTLWETAEGST